MSLSRRELVSTALLGALGAQPAQARSGRVQAALQRLVADPSHPVCGVGVALLRAGRVVLMETAGWARPPDGPDAPQRFTPDSLVRVASLSKMVTTLGALRLVDQGRLDLDADVSDVLGFALRHPRHPDVPVTLRLLLSHQAGLDDGGGYFWPPVTALADVFTGADAATHWAGAWAPGQRFSYANLGWGVIGTVMEAATGERFDHLMRRLVLEPLGSTGSYNPLELAPAQREQLAGCYLREGGQWVLQRDGGTLFGADPLRQLPPGGAGRNATPLSPTGGLRASLTDLTRVAALLLRTGPALLPERLHAERERVHWQWSPARPQDDNFDGAFLAWGLGTQRFLDRSERRPNGRYWGDRLGSQPGYEAWGHEGFAYGALTGLYYRPDVGDALVYIINGSRADLEAHPARRSSHHVYQEVLIDALRAPLS